MDKNRQIMYDKKQDLSPRPFRISPRPFRIIDAIIVATGLLYRDLMGRAVAVLTGDEMIRNANLIRRFW